MDRLVIAEGKAGRCTVLQSIADRIYQHNSTESSARDLFDELAQGIKEFRERTSCGEHLEKAIFSGQQVSAPVRSSLSV